MSSYHNSNLLYRLSLSIWTARKKDDKQSHKVTADAGATEGVANVHKVLLPECDELIAIRKWADGFRDFVYKNTLPWDDAAWRIGRVCKHMDFMAESGDRIRQGDALVDDFMKVYRKSVEQARFTLNDLFNSSDYPGENELRSKFRFTLDVGTLPNHEDFRIVDGVPKAEVEKLVSNAKSSTETRINAAMDEAYQRLYDVVSKMGNTLTAYGNEEVKKFNDTLVHNISELVDVMPALNITGDPKLQALADQARELTQYALVDLRQNAKVRNAAIREASKLAQAVKGVTEPAPKAKAPAAKAPAKAAKAPESAPAPKAKATPAPKAAKPAKAVPAAPAPAPAPVTKTKPNAKALFGDMLGNQ